MSTTGKTKLFTPLQVKADIQFVLSVAAVLGLPLSEGVSIALLGASALIAVGLNLAEAHIHVGTKLSGTVAAAVKEIRSILPAVNELVAALPGQVGAEVKKVLEAVEKGPAKTEAETAGKTKAAK